MATHLKDPDIPKNPITIAILGAGNRGQAYAEFAIRHPQWLKVVAVADQREFQCQAMVKKHNISKENIFKSCNEFVKAPKLCDAVAICTTDREHTAPAVACANLKYHILLEKPMSTNVEECVQICEAVVKNDVVFAVGHIFRYTIHNRAIKKILDSKVLGDIVNIQHLEPVGFWHFAHSYVRGNWHNESESTFSLLAKSCHDIDLLAYFMDSKFKKVSSFGNLAHFRKENKPAAAGNAKNCLDCAFESRCPYSAKKIYIEPHQKYGYWQGWPFDVVQPKGVIDLESLTTALRKGNYGKCVYEMNNDVCDHQVVNIEFENGASATFTMIAYTESMCTSKIRIFGTKGELEGDSTDKLTHFDFLTRTTRVIQPSVEDAKAGVSQSGGGDFGLMRAFVYGCVSGNKDYVVSGPQTTLDSHIYVFAAEHARKTGQVVDIKEFKKALPLSSLS